MPLAAQHYFFRIAFAVAITIVGCSKKSNESSDTRDVVPVSPSQTPEAVTPTEPGEPSGLVEPETAPVTPAPLTGNKPTESTPTGDSLYDDALAALDSGDLDLAFKLVRTAKAAAPNDPETTFLMAHVLAERNRFAEAIKLLDDLAGEVPDAKLPVLGQTADWMVVSGQWNKAERRYRMLLEQVPDASMAERKIAQLLLRQGRRQEAASSLRKLCRGGVVEQSNLLALLRLSFPFATDASAEDLDPIGPLGIARMQISRGEWQDALETLVDAKSDDPNLIALIGRIHAHQSDFDALQDWANSRTEPLTEIADYWFAMGQLRLSQNRYASAVQCFCETVLIDSTDEQAYALLGRSLDALKRESDAMSALKRSQLIQSTHTIGQRFSQGGEMGLADVDHLVESLDRLQRPFESLAWRTVRVTLQRSRSELSDSEARQAIAEINEERLNLLQSESPGPDQSFVVCGVDFNSLTESKE